MANADRPSGFRPSRKKDGSPYNASVNQYLIPAADGTAVFIGDVVVHNADSGAAGLVVSGQDCEGMPMVIRASTGTTGQNIVGVVVGFLPDPTNLALKHRLASTNRIALVEDGLADTLFEIQEDALVTPVAAASIGMDAAFTTTAGSATTGVSGMQLDSDSVVNNNAALPLKLYGLVKRPDNAFNTGGAGTDKAKFLVLFNTYLWAPNIVGV